MDSTRTGQGMMTVAIVLGMVMLTWYFSGAEEKKRNPNLDPESHIFSHGIEVPLRQNKAGHYLVTGTINGREVEFLLDTGATDVVIPENTAKQLKLPYGRKGTAMTANGAVTIYQTRISQLDIGEIRLTDINASINPGMSSGAILLGMSALRQIEFTQQGKTLTLRQLAGE